MCQVGYKCDTCHTFYTEDQVRYYSEYEAIPYGESTIMLQNYVATPCCNGECEAVFREVK